MTTEPAPPAALAQRLPLLHQMSIDMCLAQDEAELLAVAGRQVHAVFGVDWAAIALRSSDGQRFRMISLQPDQERAGAGSDLAGTELAVSRALETGQVVVEPNLSQTAFDDLAGLPDSGLGSAAVAPLTVGDYPIGALAVARRAGGAFGDDDRLFLAQAGALVAAAVKHLRTIAEVDRAETERNKAQLILARRATELDVLNRILRALNHFDLAQAIELITTEVASLRGIELCRITAVDGANRPVVVARASQHGARFQDGAPSAESGSPEVTAIERGEPVVWLPHPTNGDEPVGDRLQRLGVTSVFTMPILSAGKPIGALTAGSTGGHRLINHEHLVLAEIVCRELAAVASNGRGLASLLTSTETSPALAPAAT
jgi:GAF domain-containing protein